MENFYASKCKLKKALVFIAVLFLSLVLLAAPLTGKNFAKAEAGAPVANASARTIFNYDKLYWFSDNADSQTYSGQIASAFPGIDVEMVYKESGEFDQYISIALTSGKYRDIENAYVIFEIRHGIEAWFSKSGPNLLYDFFSDLDGNGCQIMFVCGTDELKFYKQNALLDFVDIHINTDLFTTFFANVFYNAQMACGTPQISNFTFFIDANFSEGIENGYLDCSFFREYLMKFIRSIYRDDIEFGGKKNYQVLLDNNIKLICDLGDGVYVNASNGESFTVSSYQELYENYLENDKIYAIGTTWLGSSYSYEWYSLVKDMENYSDSQDKFELYVYNDAHYTFYDPSVFTQDQGSGMFLQIVSEFLGGYDLTCYDNWEGRCAVTHKDISQGSGGWLRDFGIPDETSSYGETDEFLAFLDAWQIVLSDEVESGHEISDYDYYYNYYDDNWPPANIY